MIYFANHGSKPILDVYADAWPSGTDLAEPPKSAVHSEIVKPGEPAEFFMIRVTTPEPQPT